MPQDDGHPFVAVSVRACHIEPLIITQPNAIMQRARPSLVLLSMLVAGFILDGASLGSRRDARKSGLTNPAT